MRQRISLGTYAESAFSNSDPFSVALKEVLGLILAARKIISASKQLKSSFSSSSDAAGYYSSSYESRVDEF